MTSVFIILNNINYLVVQKEYRLRNNDLKVNQRD